LKIYKPKLRRTILDTIFNLNYQHFKFIFDSCSKDFQREIMIRAQFRYYTCRQDQDYDDEYFKYKLFDHPGIIQAFDPENSLYLILSGEIYVMDTAGMYNYGKIKSGSYFGDISILLKKKNTFSYFFNPYAEKPL
jgi:hypothetical protein